MVKKAVDSWNGVEYFVAVVSDNTSSCLSMRKKISVDNPGIISLSDQGHVANFFFNFLNVRKNTSCSRLYEPEKDVCLFFRKRQYVRAILQKFKAANNGKLRRSGDKATPNAVNFMRISTTRMAYALDVGERFI